MKAVDSKVLWSGGHVDITPSSPVQLAGFADRREPFLRVADRLEANAVMLQHGHSRVLFLQMDVLSVGENIRQRLLHDLRGRIEEKELFLTASHTHFGPNTDSRLPEMGQVDTEYVGHVVEKVTDLLERVLARPSEPALLRYGERLAACSINRRGWCFVPTLRCPPVERIVRVHPNPQGPKDDTVRVSAVCTEQSGSVPTAVLWNYACHPVGFFDYRAVSSDYPGAVRRRIRSRYGKDTPVVFLPGFSGNIRPNKIDQIPWRPRYLAHRIVNGPVFGRFSARSWNDWVNSLADSVMSALADGRRPLETPEFRAFRYSQPLQHLMDGQVDDRCLSYHVLRLDRQYVIVGLSAEAVVEYTPALQGIFPGHTVVPVGYLDGVCAYLPTSEMVREGGLEVVSPGYSLGKARYRDDVSQVIAETISKLSVADRTE